jgi:predicted RNA-binding Zn ribbon-like protein
VIDAAGEQGWVSEHAGGIELVQSACAVSLAEMVTRQGWNRIGTCAGRDCVDVFIDDRGRTARRYCSPSCLNRAKVRAYRAREAQARTAS